MKRFYPQSRNSGFDSIVDVLNFRAETEPERTAYLFLADGDGSEQRMTFGELFRKACAVAARLADERPEGERALLLYPSGLDFMAAFFGCLLAGVVPVALYPPDLRRRQARRVLERMLSIVADARTRFALTLEAILPAVNDHLAELPQLAGLLWIASDSVDDADHRRTAGQRIDPSSVAFLQYTSGSTSAPKGVVIRHRNLMYNERMIYQAVENTPESVCVSWLPVFHDMGLIGCMLHSVYAGIPCIFMPPEHFIMRPVRWLRAITRYGGTYSGAPNFAYELLIRKVTPAQKEGLDLSSWRVAFNSAEPVRAETLDRFCATFEPVGFRRRVFYPAYGLAEATVMVSGGRPQAEPVLVTVSRDRLAEGVAEPAVEGEESGVLVGAGGTVLGQRIAIADPVSAVPLAEGRVGEIWVAGANVGSGYWRNKEATRRSFRAVLAGDDETEWLRTGDLGFVLDGELFVTGRIKDLIIIAGRNHYPQDLEQTVERCHDAIRPGCAVAFAVDLGGVEGEGAVVAAEVRPVRGVRPDPAEVIATIRRAVAEDHDVAPADVCLLEPAAIPKTTSGKVERQACRRMYEQGTLRLWTAAGDG